MGPGIIRPSRVLGLLICAVLGGFAGFVMWQHGLPERDPRLLIASQWVFALGAFTAIVGWLTNAYVTVRNSVKQHTISTLLQSRLSMPYMQRLAAVNAAYSPIGKDVIPVKVEDFESTNEKTVESVAALRYLLNYFEFTALAIRHGDLDERLMEGCMAGIVCSLYKVGDALIIKAKAISPKNFENLTYLNTRWSKKKRKPVELAAVVIVGFLLMVASAKTTHAGLSYLAPTVVPFQAVQNVPSTPLRTPATTPAPSSDPSAPR